MPFPVVPVIAVGAVSALGLGGYQFGRQTGKTLSNAAPWIAAAFAAYLLVQSQKG